MVFLSGSRTVASGGLGNHIALIFRATENITINLLRIKISATGSGTSTACLVKGFIVRQVHFSDLDSTLHQINLTSGFNKMVSGDVIIFEQVGGSRYNSSAAFELDYTPEIKNKRIFIGFNNGEAGIDAVLSSSDAEFIIAKQIGSQFFIPEILHTAKIIAVAKVTDIIKPKTLPTTKNHSYSVIIFYFNFLAHIITPIFYLDLIYIIKGQYVPYLIFSVL